MRTEASAYLLPLRVLGTGATVFPDAAAGATKVFIGAVAGASAVIAGACVDAALDASAGTGVNADAS